MARRGRNQTPRSTRSSYDPLVSPSNILHSLQALENARAIVRALEDRRRYHPLGPYRPASAVSRSSRRLVVSRPGATQSRTRLPSGIRFADPQKVSLCVKRKTRREVIMAKGKGGGAHRRPRRNQFSDVKC